MQLSGCSEIPADLKKYAISTLFKAEIFTVAAKLRALAEVGAHAQRESVHHLALNHFDISKQEFCVAVLSRSSRNVMWTTNFLFWRIITWRDSVKMPGLDFYRIFSKALCVLDFV